MCVNWLNICTVVTCDKLSCVFFKWRCIVTNNRLHNCIAGYVFLVSSVLIAQVHSSNIFNDHQGIDTSAINLLTDTSKYESSLKEVTVQAPKLLPPKAGSSASGYRVDSIGSIGPFKELALQQTPFSIHITSHEEIENREAHTSADVFKTNPTIAVLMSSNTYCSMSRLQSRGFSAADQSVMRDGLCDRGFTYEPVENVEQAIALNGLSSFFYGFGTIGGSLNYITKQPTPSTQIITSAGVYNGGVTYMHGDFGGPIGSHGKLGYRAWCLS